MKVILLVFCSILPLISTKNHTGGKVSPRVVDGTDPGPTPYMCALQFNRATDACGCVIISSTWILTAANCIRSGPESMEIMVGSNVLQQGKYYKAERFISHEKYEFPKYPYNIGLVRVKGALELNNNVQPIALSKKVIQSDVEGIATGWASFPDPPPKKLGMLKLKTVSNEKCTELLATNLFPEYAPPVDDGMICTESDAKGVCSDDSGGALVVNNELIGIINWAWPCGNIGININGYARVSYYYDWIQSHMS